MAINISRNLSEMNTEIRRLTENIKVNEVSLRKFDSELAKNSGSLDVLNKKFKLLPQVINDLAAESEALKNKQKMLKESFDSGAITSQKYASQLATTNKQLSAIGVKTANYTEQLSRQNETLRNAKFDNFINGANKAKDSTQKFANVVAMATGALLAFVYQGIKVGDELDDIGNKYQTTAEDIQIWRNKFDKLTESNSGYEDSLKAIGAMQSSIVGGRGAKYLNFLAKLGMTQADLNGKSNGEIYDVIFSKLQMMTDATERATIAQGLFGDNGLNVALVASNTAEELALLDEAFIANGIITNAQAATAGSYADKIADLKQKIMTFAVVILEWWDNLGSVGKGILVFLIGAVLILPKLISLISGIAVVTKSIGVACAAAAPGVGALSMSMTKILIVIGLVAAAVLALAALFGAFKKSAKSGIEDATKGIEKITEASEKLGVLKSDMGVETTINAQSNSHKVIDLNINSHSSGDTPIAQINSDLITSNVIHALDAEMINAEWGEKVGG